MLNFSLLSHNQGSFNNEPNNNLQPLRTTEPSLLREAEQLLLLDQAILRSCEEQLDLVNSIPFKNQCNRIRAQGQSTTEIFRDPKYGISTQQLLQGTFKNYWYHLRYHPCTAKLSYILPRITRTATDHLLTLRLRA